MLFILEIGEISRITNGTYVSGKSANKEKRLLVEIDVMTMLIIIGLQLNHTPATIQYRFFIENLFRNSENKFVQAILSALNTSTDFLASEKLYEIYVRFNFHFIFSVHNVDSTSSALQ